MKTDQKSSLEIERLIKAPRERVYAAWTDPEELSQWFGPENVRTRSLVADVQVGGKYRWDIISSEGESMTCRGEYRELEPGRKIVFTWKWDDDETWTDHTSLVTVKFSDAEGGRTLLHLSHEQLPDEKSREGHIEGWNSALNKMENYLRM